MQLIPSQRIRRRRVIVTLCTAIVAAIAGVVIGLQVSHHQTAQPVAPPPVSCGETWTHSVSGQTQLLGADHGALTCFDAAARVCKPASLHVIDMGVDTGTDYVFTIEGGTEGGGTCRVTEASNFYSANGGGSTGPVTTTSCLRTAVTSAGVSLSCAGQDVLIPAKVQPGLR